MCMLMETAQPENKACNFFKKINKPKHIRKLCQHSLLNPDLHFYDHF